MSYFSGGLNALMGATYSGIVLTDLSWTRRANRLDFEHKPMHAGNSGCGRKRFPFTWPNSSMQSGDRSSGYSQMGNDAVDSSRWGEIAPLGRGNSSVKYIMGRCLASNGDPISGAHVQCYLTATDELVSEVDCDSNGYYGAPTPYTGQAHYLIAYGTGVAGASVTTLIPTNADGT